MKVKVSFMDLSVDRRQTKYTSLPYQRELPYQKSYITRNKMIYVEAELPSRHSDQPLKSADG
jgi:hypothetical protein